jgi:hypothetical protein
MPIIVHLNLVFKTISFNLNQSSILKSFKKLVPDRRTGQAIQRLLGWVLR